MSLTNNKPGLTSPKTLGSAERNRRKGREGDATYSVGVVSLKSSHKCGKQTSEIKFRAIFSAVSAKTCICVARSSGCRYACDMQRGEKAGCTQQGRCLFNPPPPFSSKAEERPLPLSVASSQAESGQAQSTLRFQPLTQTLVHGRQKPTGQFFGDRIPWSGSGRGES